MGPVEIVAGEPSGRSLTADSRRILEGLIRETGKEGASVTLLLTSDAEVRRLNRQFRGIDRATDVLSFPSGGDLEPGQPHLGDIALSVPQAERQARRAGWSVASEVALLLTHGYLHLLGHDHEKDDGTMRRLERELLEKVARVSIEDRRQPWGDGPGRHRKSSSSRRLVKR